MMTQRESKMQAKMQKELMAEAVDIERRIKQLRIDEEGERFYGIILTALYSQRATMRKVIVKRLTLMTDEQFNAALKYMTEEETK